MTELEAMRQDRDDWKATAISRAEQRDEFDSARREWQAKAEAATQVQAVLTAEVTRLRRTLTMLSGHDPSWSDDFLRARAALIGAEATLAGDTVSGLKEPESAP
jgi:hypothetical protein